MIDVQNIIKFISSAIHHKRNIWKNLVTLHNKLDDKAVQTLTRMSGKGLV